MEYILLTQTQLQCKWRFHFVHVDSDRISIQANAIQLMNIKILSKYKTQVHGKGVATMTR